MILLIIKENAPVKIKYEKSNQVWIVYKQSNVSTNLNFSWNQVRASLASRLWCFKNEKQASLFSNPLLQFQQTGNMTNNNDSNKEVVLSMENVLRVLKQDLIENKRYSVKQISEMDHYTLGITLMNEYIRFPKKSDNTSIFLIPFNYCILFEKLPDWEMIKWFMCLVCQC